MSFFKRKEKSVIPEPEQPGAGGRPGGGSDYGAQQQQQPGPQSSGGRFGSRNKQEVEPEGFQKLPGRKYTRDAPAYQPTQRVAQPGGYGNYGDYGGQQQPPAPMQQPYQGGQQQQPNYAPQQQGYGAYNAAPDARQNLFGNAKAPSARTGAAFDQYAGTGRSAASGSGSYGRSAPAGDIPDYGEDGNEAEGEQLQQATEQTEEDDEVEAIKQQIRFTKQESLSATRNAIRTARETEETATNTLTKLGQQTDRISNTELALDKAKGYNSRAADGAKEIKRLNQSIFRPQFGFNKSSKRDAEEQRILARHLEEKAEREEARQTAYDSRMRVEQGFKEAEKTTRGGRFGMGGSSSRNNAEPQDGEGLAKTGRAKWEQGGRYQFEASNSDDELEQELDSNLDEIAGITSRLKILATTAGKEIDAQNKHLDKVGSKVDNLDDKILMNTQYLKRIK